jgi:hypothetical protein
MSRAACDEVEALDITDIGWRRDWEGAGIPDGTAAVLMLRLRQMGGVGEAGKHSWFLLPLVVETATTLQGP